MIALLPSRADAHRLALDGYEELDQLHVTLVYLGQAADFDEQARDDIIDTVWTYTSRPVEARAFAVNVFNPDGDEPCLVLGVGDSDDGLLTRLHDLLYAAVRSLEDVEVAENHTPWVPHVTLAYDDVTQLLTLVPRALERVGPVMFDRVRVAFGGENTDVPLGEVLTAADDHWQDQPRVPSGENAGQWTDAPVSAKKVVSAVIYKKHADGKLVAQQETRRLRWSAGDKKFVEEKRSESGEWAENRKLTKTAAYAEMKNGVWYAPTAASGKQVPKLTVPNTEVPKVKTPENKTPEVTPKVTSTTSVKSQSSKSAVTKQIDELTEKISDLTAQSKPWREISQALTHKAGKGGVLTESDLDKSFAAQDALAEITAEAKRYADQKLALLVERDGAPWGGDALDTPSAKPKARSQPGIDLKAVGKIRDNYVINDRQTVAHNESIRSGDPTPAAKAWRTRVDKLVSSSRVTNDSVVYRGAVLPPELIMKLRPGARLTDPGIISTDEDRGTADFYADTRASYIPGMIKTMFHVNVPAGTPGADVGYGEFVFGSDSTFNILKTEYVNGEVQVYAELSPSPVKGKKK
jgi:2'-5' RNA ligase